MSNRIRIAGVSTDSLLMRLSAGCTRICSASNDSVPSSGIASSPSTTKLGRASARQAAQRPPENSARAACPISPGDRLRSPARNARQRKPSHFGSNCQPDSSGSSVTSFASIGSRPTDGSQRGSAKVTVERTGLHLAAVESRTDRPTMPDRAGCGAGHSQPRRDARDRTRVLRGTESMTEKQLDEFASKASPARAKKK